MATREHNARQIEIAARTALEKSGTYLYAAKEHAERYTRFDESWGIATQAVAGPLYEAGRRSQIKNLNDAVGRLDAMAGGLAEVARAYRGAEQANTIEPRKSAQDKVDIGKRSGKWRDLAAAYSDFVQPLTNGLAGFIAICTAIEQKFAAARLLAASAGAASVAWFGCAMLDAGSVDNTICAWKAVAANLGNVDIAADVGEALGDTDWSGDARDAYDAWVSAFMSEVADAKHAAEETASTLQGVYWTVLGLNAAMLSYASMTVLMLLYLESVGNAYPPARGIAKLVQTLVGQRLAIVAAVAGGSIVTTVGMAAGGILGVSTVIENGFGEMEVNKGGSERTFIDLGIEWDHL